MDYGYSERRKTKKDLRRKRRERVFKRGGQQRSTNIGNENNQSKA
jgi:hypothetical protein